MSTQFPSGSSWSHRVATSAFFRFAGGPGGLAVVPAVTLLSYALAGVVGLWFATLGVPAILMFSRSCQARARTSEAALDKLTGLADRAALESMLQPVLTERQASGHRVAVLVLSIDDLRTLESRLGGRVCSRIMADAAARLRTILRRSDTIVRLSDNRVAIGVADIRPPESDAVLQLARRLQSIFEEPFRDRGVLVYRSISLGAALPRQLKNATPADLIDAAIKAHDVASDLGPGTIRLYSKSLGKGPFRSRGLECEVAAALENSEIVAWFQPQISTDFGEITGIEALARWQHPTRGLISPVTFLPMIEDACLSQRLAEVVLRQALGTLASWARDGIDIPAVAVNFSGEDLRNPGLLDLIRWELDRHDLAPSRLIVEVLENVIAETREDAIARNLCALADLGCRIDLDDFGTGHTSILNIKRFSVGRLKIDRSLISRIDVDRDQRDMVAAVLSLSERLGLRTLAEGVETTREQAILAQLGCDDVQGFAIARPMPAAKATEWIGAHRARLGPPTTLSMAPERIARPGA